MNNRAVSYFFWSDVMCRTVAKTDLLFNFAIVSCGDWRRHPNGKELRRTVQPFVGMTAGAAPTWFPKRTRVAISIDNTYSVQTMNHPIYEYSLALALPLMIFFGIYFFFGRTPDRAAFGNYLRSRRIMGAALLLLALNYSVHLFCEIRFVDADAAILMNLSTYFLCYWLFSSALTTLLDRAYLTRRRWTVHLGSWILFTAMSGIVLLLLPAGTLQNVALAILAGWLVAYGFVLARRLIRTYRNAVNLFDNTNSDDIAAYIRWMSIFTYWAVIFGVGCGLLTFLPDRYIFIWILSSIPFYIYLFCSYMNYMLLYERVERALDMEPTAEDSLPEESGTAGQPAFYADMAVRLSAWSAAEGYIRPGLTIRELSEALGTNRTYLAGYIKSTYGMSFRDWITGLRIEYAKRLLRECPDLTVVEISERSGFMSPSHFMRTFKEREAYTPARWRRLQNGSK